MTDGRSPSLISLMVQQSSHADSSGRTLALRRESGFSRRGYCYPPRTDFFRSFLKPIIYCSFDVRAEEAAENSCFVRARLWVAPHKGAPRVPHIRPDFGQMWEKATVGARLPIVPENFRFKAIYPRVGAFFVMARFYRLLKNSCFVSGHDFSRAVKGGKTMGF
jgi:hypothetical protein